MNISGTAKKWDVAISFLIQDIAAAEALYIRTLRGSRNRPRTHEEFENRLLGPTTDP